MGLNIGGLCISRNLAENESALAEILEAQLDFSSYITMEEVMDDWPNEDFVDVYFCDSGTVIFCDIDFCALPYLIQGESTFSFAHIETSMSFSIIYTENASVRREITVHEEQVLDSEGEPLDFESEVPDPSELIYRLFKEVTGVSFWDIEPDTQLKRYKFKFEPKYQEIIPENADENVSDEISQADLEDNKEPLVQESYDKMDLLRKASAEQIQRDYSREELVEYCYRLIAYCQKNKWNVFLSPNGFSGERFIVLSNLEIVRSIIKNQPDLRQTFHTAMNLADFNWICSHWSTVIDDKTRQDTMLKTMLIKTPYYEVPKSDIPKGGKWWKFW